MGGGAGRHKFVGKAEVVLPRVCGMHPYVEWFEPFETGFIFGRIYEMDEKVKRAHFCMGTPMQK